jgi:hypothetical protein
MKNRQALKKGRYNFMIDASVYREFSRICEDMGIIRSKAIENHMISFVSAKGKTSLVPGARSRSKKGRYNFLISSKAYDEFSSLCGALGLIRSKNIEHFMRDFMKKHNGGKS